ncbi:PREDICTED: non-secretory ribonuclease-like [Galeopterus variegatus]|uniref:Non-secretory ribonuclease-like n=1 Tax=Galeopterus variegatus TaxID=482537 RepID=A0ABM0PZS7_GALVR|nr:PREDICTED: non-secretory ribonuclease-like [Galeopterus variegatus]
MVPKLCDSQLCLLLLGILGILISVHAQPGNLTRAQWFNIQHINMAHSQCNNAMLVVNNYRGRCKDKNTFLHTTFAAVVNVCGASNTTCFNKKTNCHNSSVQVPLTYCNLTGPPSPVVANCRYTKTTAQMFYRVACENRSPRDNATYPVVPVHLDLIF